MFRSVNFMLASLLAAATVSADAGSAPSQSAEEKALRLADEHQRDAVARADLRAIEEIAHRNLRVNAPSNRVLSREDLIRMVGSGEIRNEVFERVPEAVIITGDVGVVMGHETVLPGAASEQATLYGRRSLKRRYTNIYVMTAKGWRHLARHANVIPDQLAR